MKAFILWSVLSALTICGMVGCKKDKGNSPDTPYVPPVAVSGQWRKMIAEDKSVDIINPAMFTIGTKAYFLQGNSFYMYDQATNKFSKKTDFPGDARTFGIGIGIGQKGYYGSGQLTVGGSKTYFDWWEYDAVTDKWTRKKDMPLTVPTSMFSVSGKGYFVTGVRSYFYEYDPAADAWTQKAAINSILITEDNPPKVDVHFAINGKGYIGLSRYPLVFGTFEYEPSNDTWTKKSFQINTPFISMASTNKAYTYGDSFLDANGNAVYKNWVFTYDPAADKWKQENDFTGPERSDCIGFAIGEKVYMGFGRHIKEGTGISYEFFYDLWEYTP